MQSLSSEYKHGHQVNLSWCVSDGATTTPEVKVKCTGFASSAQHMPTVFTGIWVFPPNTRPWTIPTTTSAQPTRDTNRQTSGPSQGQLVCH